jgi:hypothetical protein
VVKHRNPAQMFPGFYYGRRIPCTWKPLSLAALTLNSFPVHSLGIGSADWRILGLGRLLQVPPQSWLGECHSRPGRPWQVRLPSWSTPVSSTSNGVCRSLYGLEASRHGFDLLEIFISSWRSGYKLSDDAFQSGD